MGFSFRDFASNLPEELARNDRALLDLLATGQVQPFIGATFDLDDAAVALRQVGEGKALGKVVLRVGSV
jgi:NADPH2:quinone reductase